MTVNVEAIRFRPLTGHERMLCRAYKTKALVEALRRGLPSRQGLHRTVVALLQEGGREVSEEDLKRAQAVAARIMREMPEDLRYPAPPNTPRDELEARGRRIVEHFVQIMNRLTDEERQALELASLVNQITWQLLPGTAEYAAEQAELAYRIYLAAVDEQGNRVFQSPEDVLGLPVQVLDRLAARALLEA